ncbi:MAG: hypothetical protein JXK94_01600 [Deltaproteobacteria bacterium]|nr:hypothetical protein [Deltaproteobacteria bacterium]
MKHDSQIVGNIGLYYACYKLSLLGWNAMPTSRNARGVDILAYNRDASRVVSIQVKALSRRDPVPMGTSLDKIMGDYWIVLSNVGKEPAAYILKAEEVMKLAHPENKDGRVSYWLEPRSYESEDFREAWGRIGSSE